MIDHPITASELLSALQCGNPRCACVRSKRNGHGLTHCPAHNDPNPSLNVDDRNGTGVWFCHAKCEKEKVDSAVLERLRGPREAKRDWTPKRLVGTYDYLDEDGNLLYQVCRYEPKRFRQRRPDGRGDWLWSLGDVRRILYRLPELISASPNRLVWIVEGEKDADRLAEHGLLATTNSEGAEKWPQECAERILRDRVIALLPDNDEPGRKHARRVAMQMHGIAAEIRIVELPGLPSKGDVSDWLDSGHTVDELKERVLGTPRWTPDGEDDEDGFDSLVEPGPVWAARASEQVLAIIPGLLVAGGLGFLISDPKAGKTWFALELSICVVSGSRMFGQYQIERSGRVLYIATEGRRDGALARFQGLCLGHKLDPGEVLQGIDFIWRRGVKLDDDDFTAWLATKSAEYVLIVVDVLVDAWDGDENKAAEASRMLRSVRPVTDAGATVLLLHHLAKDMGENGGRSIWQRLRGSSAFRGAYDSGIALERTVQGRTKVSFEHRDDAPLTPFTFSWPADLVTGKEPSALDWKAADDDLEALQRAQATALQKVDEQPGISKRDLRGRLGVKTETASAAIEALLRSRQLEEREITYVRSNGRPGLKKGVWKVVPDLGNHREPGSNMVPLPGNQREPAGTTFPTTPSGRLNLVPEGGRGTKSPPGGNQVQPGGEAAPGPGTSLACPACGAMDYEPLAPGHLHCLACGNDWVRPRRNE